MSQAIRCQVSGVIQIRREPFARCRSQESLACAMRPHGRMALRCEISRFPDGRDRDVASEACESLSGDAIMGDERAPTRWRGREVKLI
jgi:hypothetical protein